MSDPRREAVTRILNTTTQLSAKTTFYAAALSSIYLMASGTNPDMLPPALATFAGGLGVEALGSLIDRVANGDAPSDEDIRERVLDAVDNSKIGMALTRDEFRADLNRLLRKTHLNTLQDVIAANHKTLAERLVEQSEQLGFILDELPRLRRQVQNIHIEGDVSAGIANIGGTMTFAGDITVNYGAFPQGVKVNRHFCVFLSSPGDVSEERAIVRDVVEKLNGDMWMDHMGIRLDLIAWDNPNETIPMMANRIPQESVNEAMAKPSECDIVIVMLWSRMGTPLTDKLTKPDGSTYQSGTEWEYHDALAGYEQTGKTPLVLVYRRKGGVQLDPDDPNFEDNVAQYQRVKAFFEDFYDGETILRGLNEYNTPATFRDTVERHLKKLIAILAQDTLNAQAAAPVAGVSPGEPSPLPEPDWNRSPFPGLRAFTPADAPIFYGRGAETDALTRLVGERGFVAVVGASGSGKSSLVGAGLLPRLREGEQVPESAAWHLPDAAYQDDRIVWTGLRFTPNEEEEENPFTPLAYRLRESGLVDEPIGTLKKALRGSPGYLAEALATAHPDTTFLLFIDQFEELFTVVEERHRRPFTDMLIAAADAPNIRVVVTVRADFIHHFIAYGRLNDLLNAGTYTLATPRLGALYTMITHPARRAGLRFEPELPEMILSDTGTEPGGLALLAYALDGLYNAATERGDGALTTADYAALGRVQGAIGTRAEAAFAALPGTDEHKRDLLGRVFRYLVSVDERGVATRQRWAVRRQHLPEDMNALVDAFVDARLLVSSDAGATDGTVTLEVAHEALLRSWMRLTDWITEAQEDLILLRQVRAAAQDWDNRGRPDGFRWNHERLTLVYAMWERLGETAKTLLDDRDLIEIFIEPEQERLYRELDEVETTHQRRYDIGERLARIGDTREGIGLKDGVPDMAWLPVAPGGEIDVKGQTFTVQPFYIAKYLTTYAQFQAFIDGGEYDDPRWWEGFPEEYQPQNISNPVNGNANAPRDSISWYQSVAFARWMNHKLQGLRLPHPVVGTRPALSADDAGVVPTELVIGDNAEIRLPTEWEWQWAAQGGSEGRQYPWGEWREGYANTTEAGINDRSTAVGMYPHGAAVCGALDMAGNLLEWCLNKNNPPEEMQVDDSGDRRVRRGGSFFNFGDFAAAAYRLNDFPYDGYYDRGLRLVCVLSAP